MRLAVRYQQDELARHAAEAQEMAGMAQSRAHAGGHLAGHTRPLTEGRRIQLKQRAGYSATPRTHASAGQGLRDDPIHYRIDPTARSTVGD
jgi:hypothetical protein